MSLAAAKRQADQLAANKRARERIAELERQLVEAERTASNERDSANYIGARLDNANATIDRQAERIATLEQQLVEQRSQHAEIERLSGLVSKLASERDAARSQERGRTATDRMLIRAGLEPGEDAARRLRGAPDRRGGSTRAACRGRATTRAATVGLAKPEGETMPR